MGADLEPINGRPVAQSVVSETARRGRTMWAKSRRTSRVRKWQRIGLENCCARTLVYERGFGERVGVCSRAPRSDRRPHQRQRRGLVALSDPVAPAASFYGSAWARQGFARCARRSAPVCRALDPPGALPEAGNCRSDRTTGWAKPMVDQRGSLASLSSRSIRLVLRCRQTQE